LDPDVKALVQALEVGKITRRGFVRRAVLAGVALPVALRLAGLGQAPVSAAASKVKLTLWGWTHPPTVELDNKLINEYMELNPSVEAARVTIPNQDYGQKLLVGLATGQGPDIARTKVKDAAAYIQKGYLAPVDYKAFGAGSLQEWEKRYVPGVLNGLKAGGNIYGVICEASAPVLFYNKAHFKEAGLDSNKPPRTWDELVSMGKKLVKKDANGRMVRKAFDFVYLHSQWYMNRLQTLLAQTGGGILDATNMKVVINRPESVHALQLWYDLIYKHHIADPAVGQRDFTDPEKDFVTETASMWMGDLWAVDLIKANPAVYKNLGIAPLPQLNPAKPGNFSDNAFLFVTKQSKNPAEAWKFISFLTSKEDAWIKIGFPMVKAGWERSAAAKSAIPNVGVFAAEIAHSIPGIKHPAQGEIADIVKRACERSLLDRMDPKKSLDTAAAEIQKAIA
jgi:sn-glycerol 3-phosphate transport system substrate-binding protein